MRHRWSPVVAVTRRLKCGDWSMHERLTGVYVRGTEISVGKLLPCTGAKT